MPRHHDCRRFSPAAVKLSQESSGGIPRLVNTLCDRALEAASRTPWSGSSIDSVIAAAERLRRDSGWHQCARCAAARPADRRRRRAPGDRCRHDLVARETGGHAGQWCGESATQIGAAH